MNETNGRAKYTAPQMPKVAALYVRVSSEDQAKDGKSSPQTQLAALRKKAAELDFATAEEYIYEDHHSGEELFERKALSRLREDARARRFGLVLAYNVYALAKNQAHLGLLKLEWDRLGIRMAFATEEVEDTPVGRAMRNMLAFAAEMEGERRKDRVQRARQARAEAGNPIAGSRAPYGYKWTDMRRADGRLAKAQLVEDPTTAAVVRRIYSMADQGASLRSIAATLTAERVPTPTGRSPVWDRSTLLKILHNPIYKGEARALRTRMVPVDPTVRDKYKHSTREVPRPDHEQVSLPEDYAPAFVTPEVWARVAERLRRNQELSPRNNRQPTASILRGLVRCGHCGYRMSFVNTTQMGPIVRCGNSMTIPGRPDRCVSQGNAKLARELEPDVWADVAEYLKHPERVKAHNERVRTSPDPEAENMATLDTRLKKIKQDIAKIQDYVLRLDDHDALAQWGLKEQELWRELRKLEADRQAAESRAENREARKHAFEDLISMLEVVKWQVDAFDERQRRNALLALDIQVRLWRAGERTPRHETNMRITLGALKDLGATSVPDGSNCDDLVFEPLQSMKE
jgi:site-specific DNA recombinase